MTPLKIMIKLYMIGEPITAWGCLLISVLGIFISFLMSRKVHENTPHFDLRRQCS